MADLRVTIPTAGRDTLAGAIETCGVDRDRIVIVATAGSVDAPGCHVVEDFGEINIHRWWNAGIDYAQAHGATHVAVLNDDVHLGEGALSQLLDGIGTAAIATPGIAGHVTDPDRDRRRTIDGACWVLDLESGLRPDEGYRWWYGDDDLDYRARRDHGGVIALLVQWEHLHPNQQTSTRADLQALTHHDAARWRSR